MPCSCGPVTGAEILLCVAGAMTLAERSACGSQQLEYSLQPGAALDRASAWSASAFSNLAFIESCGLSM